MSDDEAFVKLTSAVTSAIDDHGLTPEEVTDAVEEGVANSTAGSVHDPPVRRKKKPSAS